MCGNAELFDLLDGGKAAFTMHFHGTAPKEPMTSGADEIRSDPGQRLGLRGSMLSVLSELGSDFVGWAITKRRMQPLGVVHLP